MQHEVGSRKRDKEETGGPDYIQVRRKCPTKTERRGSPHRAEPSGRQGTKSNTQAIYVIKQESF